MKQKILSLILKKLIKDYFKNYGLLDNLSEEQYLGGYADMDTDRCLNTLRNRFTNLLAEQVVAKKGSEEISKGRVLELFGILNDIENAKENLVKLAEKKRIESYRKDREQRPDILQVIKNKLAGFRKANKRNQNSL
jgi:hypothetical protein